MENERKNIYMIFRLMHLDKYPQGVYNTHRGYSKRRFTLTIRNNERKWEYGKGRKTEREEKKETRKNKKKKCKIHFYFYHISLIF